MSRQVLFAHERPSIVRAVERVLELYDFDVTPVRSGHEAARLLEKRRFDALVVDVALPGMPGYELTALAKRLAEEDEAKGAAVVVLVASVYRRTSYKRRPTRLYGADDYVEIHHLGDQLPEKLVALCGAPMPQVDVKDQAQDEVKQALRDEGDTRLQHRDAEGLATLIVADVVLYNGDAIVGARDFESATAAVGEDLEIARALYGQVAKAAGWDELEGDPVGAAFGELMRVMGRTGGDR